MLHLLVSHVKQTILFFVLRLTKFFLSSHFFCRSVRLKLVSDLPLVGHCVSILMDTLQSFEAKKLRRAVLSTMLALSGVDASSLGDLIGYNKLTNQSGENEDDVIQEADSESTDKYDPTHILSTLTKSVGVSVCAEMGGVFASFLPGITIALTRVMTSDIKVGSSVTVLALFTWAHYVAIVMDHAQINEPEMVSKFGIENSSGLFWGMQL